MSQDRLPLSFTASHKAWGTCGFLRQARTAARGPIPGKPGLPRRRLEPLRWGAARYLGKRAGATARRASAPQTSPPLASGELLAALVLPGASQYWLNSAGCQRAILCPRPASWQQAGGYSRAAGGLGQLQETEQKQPGCFGVPCVRGFDSPLR